MMSDLQHIADMPTLDELAQAIKDLDTMPAIERATAARRLARSLPVHLAVIADDAVYAATRVDTQPTVAARLGVTKAQVERAVTRHRARLA